MQTTPRGFVSGPKPCPHCGRVLQPLTADLNGREVFAGWERFRWALSMEFEGTKEFATSVARTLKGLGLTGASIVCTGVIGHD